MSQFDDIEGYARTSVRERERSAAEHRLAHDAVAGAARFAGARRLFSRRRRDAVPEPQRAQRPQRL